MTRYALILVGWSTGRGQHFSAEKNNLLMAYCFHSRSKGFFSPTGISMNYVIRKTKKMLELIIFMQQAMRVSDGTRSDASKLRRQKDGQKTGSEIFSGNCCYVLHYLTVREASE